MSNQPSSHDFVSYNVSRASKTQTRFGTKLPLYVHFFRTDEAMLVDVQGVKEELLARFPSPEYKVSMRWRKNGYNHEELSWTSTKHHSYH